MDLFTASRGTVLEFRDNSVLTGSCAIERMSGGGWNKHLEEWAFVVAVRSQKRHDCCGHPGGATLVLHYLDEEFLFLFK